MPYAAIKSVQVCFHREKSAATRIMGCLYTEVSVNRMNFEGAWIKDDCFTSFSGWVHVLVLDLAHFGTPGSFRRPPLYIWQDKLA